MKGKAEIAKLGLVYAWLDVSEIRQALQSDTAREYLQKLLPKLEGQVKARANTEKAWIAKHLPDAIAMAEYIEAEKWTATSRDARGKPIRQFENLLHSPKHKLLSVFWPLSKLKLYGVFEYDRKHGWQVSSGWRKVLAIQTGKE